jgi:hypothetical protein
MFNLPNWKTNQNNLKYQIYEFFPDKLFIKR